MFELRYNKIPFRIIRKNYEDEANEFILKGYGKHLKLVHKPIIINNNRALKYELSLEHSVSKKPFLSINVDENDNIVNYKCEYCGEYNVSYHACKHLLAVAKVYDEVDYGFNKETLDEMFEKLERDIVKKEYQAKRKERLNEIRPFVEMLNRINVIPLIDKVGIDSYIYGTNGNYILNFKVGTDKKYVIQNILNFIKAVNESEVIQYGKKFAFTHDITNFDEFSQKIIKFLQATEYDNITKNVNLTPVKMENLIDLYVGKKIFIQVGSDMREVYVTDEVRDIKYKLDKDYRLILEEFDTALIGFTKDYCIKDNMLYVAKTSSQAERALLKYLSVNNDLTFEYIKDIMEKNIYPRFQNIIEVDESIKDSLKIVDFKIKLYFDMDENEISYSMKYYIDDKEVSESKAEDYLYKVDVIRSYLNNIGFDDSQKITDKIKTFNFLKSDLSQLKGLCEIYLSENIKKVKIKTASSFQARMSYNVGMLDVCFEQSEFTDEELSKIVLNLKKKIRFIKLNKDTIIEITEEDANKLLNTIKEFNLDINNLTTPQSVPLYQALKVTTEAINVVDYKLDDKLKSLLNDITEYKELDFNINNELKEIMRPYQIDAFKWMKVLASHNFCGILADEMGLGKTLEVISVILDDKIEAPTLVVCPKSLCYNWKHEFAIWSSKCNIDIDVINVIGGISERKEIISNINLNKKAIYISSYDSLRNDIDLYEDIEFNFLILDEAQSIKNHQTMKAKSVKRVKSKNRFVLTGTPIENSITDLWSLFDFLMPNYLGTYSDFREKYEADVIYDEQDTVLKLVKKISPFVLRRTKKEVLKDLPDKVESIQIATMSKDQRRVYDAQLLKTRRMLQNILANKIDILAHITRLRQICVDPRLFMNDYYGDSAKLNLVSDLLEQYVPNGHKVIIFSQFTSSFELLVPILKDLKIKYFILTGKTNPYDRVEMANTFNDPEDDHKVFLVSLKAGGTGLNLVGADVVIHLDPWWNYAVENQATDRAHRIGQKNAVSVIKVICEDSIEQKVIELQRIKRDIADKIILSDENSNTKIAIDDLKYLLD